MNTSPGMPPDNHKMEARLDSEYVGREFDKWLDWSGAADEANSQYMPPLEEAKPSLLPISPVSNPNSDPFSAGPTQTPYTATYTHDLPTPTNSGSSPETLANPFRLSGDSFNSGRLSMSIQNPLKRKLSPVESFEQDFRPITGRPTGSKRPHNVIEKRYRANLNEKIAELRDSVPALRAVKKSKGKKDPEASSDDEDLEGLTASNKLNKASILTKAVEYIRHLELRTKKLEDENRILRGQITGLEKIVADGGHDAARASAFTSEITIEPSAESCDTSGTTEPRSEPKGLIEVPESFRRMREQQSQEHYGHVYTSQPASSRLSGKWPQRIMLASLAGLMVMEGLSESDNNSKSQKKALFGIPIEILDGWTFLRSPRLYLSVFAQYCRSGGALPLVKGFVALTILAFLVFYYMFNSKPTPKKANDNEAILRPIPARPASPIEVRRRAWSTSMQALGLPHHSFFPEWFAVTSEWVNYTIRYWLGPKACLWMCGETAEDEIARIKAWDIAIDAQLAGGDHEISRSRSVLTIFGSGTLPPTPLRLMLKAMHTKVVLHNVGLAGTLSSKIASQISMFIADRQWRRARQMHEALSSRHPDRLSGYLNYLLQMDCDEVLSNAVTQRAYNMMYDRPTSEYAEDSLMDVVVEDHAIRSPLDAVAAWRSTAALQEALSTALQRPDATDLLREHIQAALEIAPPGSAAETRALAVHAVLSPGRRDTFYLRAADALRSHGRSTEGERVPHFIDSSTPLSARPEIATVLSCAQAMLRLEQERNLLAAIDVLSGFRWPDLGINCAGSTISPTMLSVAPIYFVLTRLVKASRNASDCSSADCDDNLHPLPQLNTLAQRAHGILRAEAARLGIELEGRKTHLSDAIEHLCACWDMRPSSTTSSRRQSSASHDTGYGSLEEEVDTKDLNYALRGMSHLVEYNGADASPISNRDVLVATA